jgi:multiple sugar transport system substrate-binding protein
MVKKVLVLLLALSLCGSLFAGGGSNRGSQSGSQGKVTLRIVYQEDDWEKSHKAAFEYFAKQYPDVTLESIGILNSEYVEKATVMLAGGDNVDLVYSKAMPQYVNMAVNGQIIDLLPYIQRDNIDTSKFNGATERMMIDGKLYALPFRSDIWQLYYNKNLFDKAGIPYPSDNMTWEEYSDLCKRLTSGSGTNKVYGGFFQSWPAAVQNIAIQDGRNTTVAANYEFMRPAYQTVLDLQRGGYIVDYAEITTGNLHYSGQFLNQRVATVYQGSWFVNLLLTEMKRNGLAFEWGVAKAPHPRNVSAGYVVGTAFPMCITSISRNKDMAWEYAKFLAGEENSQHQARNGALPAVTNDTILNTLISQEGMPANSASAFEYTNLSFETPVNSRSGAAGTILGEEHGLVMTGSISIDEFINNLNRRIGEVLKN